MPLHRRSRFLANFFVLCLGLSLIGGVWAGGVLLGSVRILIQESPLAGSQFHDLGIHWERLEKGTELNLVREPENPHDSKAIRVEWQGHLLGYVPRRENKLISAAMDAGDQLVAKVVAIQPHRNPWLRVRFAVYSIL